MKQLAKQTPARYGLIYKGLVLLLALIMALSAGMTATRAWQASQPAVNEFMGGSAPSRPPSAPPSVAVSVTPTATPEPTPTLEPTPEPTPIPETPTPASTPTSDSTPTIAPEVLPTPAITPASEASPTPTAAPTPTVTVTPEPSTQPEPGRRIIVGSKTWRHGENPTEQWPASITIYLKDQYGVVLQREISEADHWSWRFEVERYDSHGNEYVYTVDEAPVPGYVKHINGLSIVNHHESYEYITLAGTKTWEHGGNVGARPDSIVVQVWHGDKMVAEQTVTAANGWEYAFTLSRYDADGQPIGYVIREANVPGYTQSGEGNELHNRYVGPDYPGDYPDSPHTGDNSSLWRWLTVLLVSSALLSVLLVIGRRKEQRGRYARKKT